MKAQSIRRWILAVTFLGLVQLGLAQDSTGRPTKISSVQSENAPAGPQEGIKVHGHWTVIVRNADGSVDSRHEFENSINDGGKGLLLNMLTGSLYTVQALPPVWQLKIGGPACAQQQTGYCLLPVQPQLNHGQVEMTGTFKMATAGQITSVATEITNTIGPHHDPLHFSSRDLTQPDATGQTPASINVQAGQNVDFTVDISIT